LPVGLTLRRAAAAAVTAASATIRDPTQPATVATPPAPEILRAMPMRVSSISSARGAPAQTSFIFFDAVHMDEDLVA
jgi:hypothetical protein